MYYIQSDSGSRHYRHNTDCLIKNFSRRQVLGLGTWANPIKTLNFPNFSAFQILHKIITKSDVMRCIFQKAFSLWGLCPQTSHQGAEPPGSPLGDSRLPDCLDWGAGGDLQRLLGLYATASN